MERSFLRVFSCKKWRTTGWCLKPCGVLCVYIDDLLVRLARVGVGCFIGRKFVGALAYADDIILVAPTASALRKMLAVCDNYATGTEYYTAFNAHKSKCMVLLPSVCRYLARELGNCVFTLVIDQWNMLTHICILAMSSVIT